MPSEDTYFKIDESTPKNAYILKEVKKVGSLSKLSKLININLGTLSLALNCKKIPIPAKIKIARYFKKDSAEIF